MGNSGQVESEPSTPSEDGTIVDAKEKPSHKAVRMLAIFFLALSAIVTIFFMFGSLFPKGSSGHHIDVLNTVKSLPSHLTFFGQLKLTWLATALFFIYAVPMGNRKYLKIFFVLLAVIIFSFVYLMAVIIPDFQRAKEQASAPQKQHDRNMKQTE